MTKRSHGQTLGNVKREKNVIYSLEGTPAKINKTPNKWDNGGLVGGFISANESVGKCNSTSLRNDGLSRECGFFTFGAEYTLKVPCYDDNPPYKCPRVRPVLI